MNIKFDVVHISKRDIAPIIVLIFLTLFSRLLLILNAPVVYYVDSYTYINKAIDLYSHRGIQFEVGIPFVICLSSLFFIFGSSFGAIMISRFFMLFLTTLIICIIYLFGLKMSCKLFGLVAAILAIFEPFFLTYSIVPHNDVFAIALGLLALYFITYKNSKVYDVISLILFYIVSFTRPEFYVVLIFPILYYYYTKHLKNVLVQNMIQPIFFCSLFFIPGIWVSSTYLTRFDIIEKFSLFLTPDLFQSTLNFLFKFYDQALLNRIFITLVALGIGCALLNTLKKIFIFEKRNMSFFVKCNHNPSYKEIFFSDRVTIAICLFLISIIHIIILTVSGYGYTIVDDILIINKYLPERYVILNRLLLSYPLAYILTLTMQRLKRNTINIYLFNKS